MSKIILAIIGSYKEDYLMTIDESIRKVKRPINTVIDDSGRDSINRYSVRERGTSKYVPGRNPQPRNAGVIGHIIDGVYVHKKSKTAEDGP